MVNLLKNEEVKKNIITGVKVSGEIIGWMAVTYVKALVISTATVAGMGIAGYTYATIQDKKNERNNNNDKNILETDNIKINLNNLSIEEK